MTSASLAAVVLMRPLTRRPPLLAGLMMAVALTDEGAEAAGACRYTHLRSILRILDSCRKFGMPMHMWWDDSLSTFPGQLCVEKCPDGLVAHQMQCVLPEALPAVADDHSSFLNSPTSSVELIARAHLCGTDEERWLALQEAKLRIAVHFKVPMSEVRIDTITCPLDLNSNDAAERALGDLMVRCASTTTTTSTTSTTTVWRGTPAPTPPTPAAIIVTGPEGVEPHPATSRNWRIMAVWSQASWLGVSEVRLFEDVACTLPLPLPGTGGVTASSNLGDRAVAAAFDRNSSTAFVHDCRASPSSRCEVFAGTVYIEVSFPTARTIRCVSIAWIRSPPRSAQSGAAPLWVVQYRDEKTRSRQWIDGTVVRGADRVDACFGVACGLNGVCRLSRGNVAECDCFPGFRGKRCEEFVGSPSMSPKIVDAVPGYRVPWSSQSGFREYHYLESPGECGQKSMEEGDFHAWSYNPWLKACRISNFARDCSAPEKADGWMFFEVHSGLVRVPHSSANQGPTDECPASADERGGPSDHRIISVRISSPRLANTGNKTLQEGVLRLAPAFETLLGFPAELVAAYTSGSSTATLGLVPLQRSVALRHVKSAAFIALNPSGAWQTTFVSGTPEAPEDRVEILDAGSGLVVLRSATPPHYYLRMDPVGLVTTGIFRCLAAVIPRGAELSAVDGLRFKVVAVAERGVVFINVDYRRPLKFEPACGGGSLWPNASIAEDEVFSVVADGPLAAPPPEHGDAPAIVFDQHGQQMGLDTGMESAEAWAAVGDSPMAPITWEGINPDGPAVLGPLRFGVWMMNGGIWGDQALAGQQNGSLLDGGSVQQLGGLFGDQIYGDIPTDVPANDTGNGTGPDTTTVQKMTWATLVTNDAALPISVATVVIAAALIAAVAYWWKGNDGQNRSESMTKQHVLTAVPAQSTKGVD
eukprot:TRINITY_DN35081_c0_g1_i2.p1 TRINITY_DN35081_c0_g1~~TRINITY_DN35081_c0_g1_i2.p1  ORF type:complete len:927 (+),score=140.38 TRINITY_DN35081_c0_g1_i2:125-2905(+)